MTITILLITFHQTKDANTSAKEVISMMESYNMTREDWDSVMEIGKWGNEPDITSKIPSKVSQLTIEFLRNKKTRHDKVESDFAS